MPAAKPIPDLSHLDETALVDLAWQGRREAFAAIMQRCNQRLFRVARGVVRDDAEAEDVLQEAYVRAFTAIGGFRGEAGVLTWLTRIVLNEARARLRRRRNLVGLEALDEPRSAQVIAFPGASPEADAARSQMRALIEGAVDDLSEPFRLVFLMRDVDGCSVEETAQALGLRPETVKTRLHRARRQLRAALDEKLASTLTSAFPFLGERCNRITQRVLERLERT